ncbi:MAG: glycosyl hydrolase [Terriglobia bacterium]
MWTPTLTSRWLIGSLFVVLAIALLSPGFLPLEKVSAGSGPTAEIERLLNPESLRSSLPPPTLTQIEHDFLNPPAEFRSMPLWSWNDELEWPRLRDQLQQFKQQGMGGVFIHPRPGLKTEYFGPEWFRLWKLALDEGARLGLIINIYDENSYPSGFSGGHVPARAPDTAAQFVQAEASLTSGSIDFKAADLVSAFVAEKSASGAVVSVRQINSPSPLADGQTLVHFHLRRASGNPWTAGFPYVDLTNPDTSKAFLETTFENYKAQIGQHFGTTVKWVFDDEPLIATAGAYDNAPLALPMSRNTLAEFQKRCHYDLAAYLPSLYWDVGDYRKVRFDYWQTLHDLWKENYFRPIFLWCDQNRLQFTGHWMEHEWPYPWISPADASLYAYEHAPGIDMLEGAGIRTQGADPHHLFTIKQVSSVAHQLGRRAFCEAYGASGWDSTFEHYKRFGDWLLVHGITFMDQHLSFYSVRGARKRDHPQSFSDISPWWPYYKIHGDYLGRLSYALSRGEPDNRVVILEPTTSGFLGSRREGATPELAQLSQSYGETVQFLADHQVDFDLADEYILEWFGRGAGPKLQVGKANYDLVIWPFNMTNVRRQTVPLLEQFLEHGGQVLALSPPAVFVDGRPSEEVKAIAQKYRQQWKEVADLPALLVTLHQRLKPRIELRPALPNVGLNERVLPGGERLLFFANTGLVSARTKVNVEGRGLQEWDPITGQIRPAYFHPGKGNTLEFDLDLQPAASKLLLVKNSIQEAPVENKPPRFLPLETSTWRINPDAPNVLVLDYCDLSISGNAYRDINTWKANWTLWQMHGFERPAWDNAVQFKTRIFDRNSFPEDSGFTAEFHFHIDDASVLPDLELALESPELFQISLNQTAVSFERSSPWLDPHLRSIPIEPIARVGENTLILTGKPFDVRMELENIYLRGNFKAIPASKGFRLASAVPTQFGSWARQGLPFFPGSVKYETELFVPSRQDGLRIELGKWEGSLAAISIDHQAPVLLGWPPYTTEIPIASGKHTLEINIVSTPRNVFGPFHDPLKTRMRAWSASWANFPDHQPPGDQYDVIDYGLMAPPVIKAGTVKGP